MYIWAHTLQDNKGAMKGVGGQRKGGEILYTYDLYAHTHIHLYINIYIYIYIYIFLYI